MRAALSTTCTPFLSSLSWLLLIKRSKKGLGVVGKTALTIFAISECLNILRRAQKGEFVHFIVYVAYKIAYRPFCGLSSEGSLNQRILFAYRFHR